jgi:hypothetical protein
LCFHEDRRQRRILEWNLDKLDMCDSAARVLRADTAMICVPTSRFCSPG